MLDVISRKLEGFRGSTLYYLKVLMICSNDINKSSKLLLTFEISHQTFLVFHQKMCVANVIVFLNVIVLLFLADICLSIFACAVDLEKIVSHNLFWRQSGGNVITRYVSPICCQAREFALFVVNFGCQVGYAMLLPLFLETLTSAAIG